MTPEDLQASDDLCRRVMANEPLLRDMRHTPSPAALRALAVPLFEHELAMFDEHQDAALTYASYNAATRENVLKNAAWVLGRLRYAGFALCDLEKLKRAVGE